MVVHQNNVEIHIMGVFLNYLPSLPRVLKVSQLYAYIQLSPDSSNKIFLTFLILKKKKSLLKNSLGICNESPPWLALALCPTRAFVFVLSSPLLCHSFVITLCSPVLY